MNIFVELSIILVIAVVVTAIIRLLKQPLIIGYIISGILVGPYLFNLLHESMMIESLARVGIALLLFIVGLGLNPKMIKAVGKVSLITGIGQVLFTSLFGFFISRLLGFSIISSVYIAVALTFSSTIIIMKLLSDKEDLEKLYGRISIGFLIVQDLIVAIALILISSLSKGSAMLGLFAQSIAIIIVLTALIFVFSKYVLSKIMKSIAKSQEFLLLFALAWCFVVCAIFYMLDFSIEVGALLAGIALASVPYKVEISSKLKPLRDFFLVLFFISLGSQIVFTDIGAYILPIIIFSLFILIGNPLIVLIIMGLLGYTKRNGFLAGLTVAQISEFSLVLISLGISVGHLSEEILSLVTVIGLITIAGSSYLITYGDKIYLKVSKFLNIFEKKGRKVDEHKYYKEGKYETILFGYNRMGSDVLGSLKKMKKKILIVDFNPDIVLDLAKKGYNVMYGDASDLELLNEINFQDTKLVVSTVPDIDVNLLLISKVKNVNKNVIMIAISQQIDEAIELYNHGVDYVVLPHFISGQYASGLIERFGFDNNLFFKEKLEHLKYLKKKNPFLFSKKNNVKKNVSKRKKKNSKVKN